MNAGSLWGPAWPGHYRRLCEVLARELPLEGREGTTRRRALQVSAAFHRDPRVPLRYDESGVAFAHRYYAVNFCQAYLAGRRVAADLPGQPSVLDLGGGSGAGAAGFLSALQDAGRRPRLTLVDRSVAQLRLFRAVARPYLDGLPGGAPPTTLVRSDAAAFLRRSRGHYDAVLAAYAFAEMRDGQIRRTASLVRRRLRPAGRFVVLEMRGSGALRLVEEGWGAPPAQRRMGRAPVRIPACRQVSGGRSPVGSRTTLLPGHAVFAPEPASLSATGSRAATARR